MAYCSFVVVVLKDDVMYRAMSKSSDELHSVLLGYSRQYRLLLGDLYNETERERVSNDTVEDLDDDLDDLLDYRTLWHMCEIFGIQAQISDVNGALVESMLNWLNSRFVERTIFSLRCHFPSWKHRYT